MSAIALLKSEQNSVEFYTVEATGNSGISQSGLAILSGVSQQAISKLEATLTTGDAPEWLKPLAGGAFALTTANDQLLVDGKNAGNLKIYNAAFSVAVIKHYADKGNKEAIYSLMKFAEMGFDTWVQTVTGWSDRAQSRQSQPPTLNPSTEFMEAARKAGFDDRLILEVTVDRFYSVSQTQPAAAPQQPQPSKSVSVQKRKHYGPKLGSEMPSGFQRVLAVLSTDRAMSAPEVAKLADMSESNARKMLVYLCRQKLAHRAGVRDPETRGWRYTYHKVETARQASQGDRP